jgi:hypothetical protein
MHRRVIALATALTAALTVGAPLAQAGGKAHLYVGIHPLDTDIFCYIEAPHQHAVAPLKANLLYRVHDGHHHFVGDPVAFSYDGPKHAYYGHHPVSVSVVLDDWARYPHGEEYCYLDGAHYHYFEPADPKFVLKGDAYWYVGTLPPAYKKHKRARSRINAVYTDVHYERPVVVVEPPTGYAGVVVSGPAVRAGVGVEVVVPEPVIEVDLGFGIGFGHVHHDHCGHHGHWKHKHGKYKKHKKYKRGKYRRGYTRHRYKRRSKRYRRR